MVYEDFKIAAERHKVTCLGLSAMASTSTESSGLKIYANIYYLSGYIVECCLKYCIYDVIGFDPKADVTSLNQDGLIYKKDIKTHQKDHLLDVLNSKVPGMILSISDPSATFDTEVVKMVWGWEPKFRYESGNFLNNKIEECLELIIITKNELLNSIRG